MSQSAYDRDGDGVCEAASCDGLFALAHFDRAFDGGTIAEQIAEDLRQIGIRLRVELVIRQSPCALRRHCKLSPPLSARSTPTLLSTSAWSTWDSTAGSGNGRAAI